MNAPVFYVDSGITPKLTSGYAGYSVTSTSARKDVWVSLGGFSSTALKLNAKQSGNLPLGDLAGSSTTPAFFLLDGTAATAAQSHTVTVYAGKPGSGASTALCTATGSFLRVEETIQAQSNKVQDVSGDGKAVTVSTTTPQLGGTVTVSVEGETGQVGSGPADDFNSLYMTPTALTDFPADAFRLVGTSLHMSADGTVAPVTRTNLLRFGPMGSKNRTYTATYTFRITGTTSTATRLYPIQQLPSGVEIKHTSTGDFDTLIPPIAPVTNPLSVQLTATPNALEATGGTVSVTQTLRSTASTVSAADSLVATVPAGATFVTGSARLNGSPVTDPARNGTTLTFAGPVATSSTTPAVLTYDLTLPATSGSYRLEGTGLLNATVLDTTTRTDDTAPASATITVGPVAPQTITFPALPNTDILGAPPVPSATSDSGLPVSYTGSTPEICTVASDGTISLLDLGTCTVTATQPGNGLYAPAAPVSRSFLVTDQPVATSQTIIFPPLTDTAINDAALSPAAIADSGLPVSYGSTTPSVCSVAPSGEITLLATGTCTVEATQAGNATFSAATPLSRSFAVTLAPQTIDFPALPTTAVDADAPVPAASASSNLPVGYSSTTPQVCTISAGTIALVAPGTCTIEATQGGNGFFAAAAAVSRSFEVTPAGQSITFPALPDVFVGAGAPVPAATATSNLPVSYSSSTPEVCTISGSSVQLVGAGICTLVATQPGNGRYAPAASVNRSFSVLRHGQTITFPPLADAVLTRGAPTPAAIASSGLPVVYTSQTPAVCTVTNGALTLIAPGTCTIEAAQPGDGTRDAAPTVAGSFTVAAPPPLTVAPGGGSTVGPVPGSVQLGGLPAGAVVTVAPDAATTIPGLARVTVTGTTVVLVADPTFSGVLAVPVTVRADGQTRTTTVRLVVTPNVAKVPAARLTDASHTTVGWKPSPNATGYEVRLGTKVVCVTRTTSCRVAGLLGPKAALTVTALGGSGTRSAVVRPAFQSGALVRVASVYFASDSSALSPAARATLDRVVVTMRTQGFGRLDLVGNTDSRASYLYNLGLSRQRAESVQRYIAARLAGTGIRMAVTYRSETTPAASNATPQGRALNRRTDVSLG